MTSSLPRLVQPPNHTHTHTEKHRHTSHPFSSCSLSLSLQSFWVQELLRSVRSTTKLQCSGVACAWLAFHGERRRRCFGKWRMPSVAYNTIKTSVVPSSAPQRFDSMSLRLYGPWVHRNVALHRDQAAGSKTRRFWQSPLLVGDHGAAAFIQLR